MEHNPLVVDLKFILLKLFSLRLFYKRVLYYLTLSNYII